MKPQPWSLTLRNPDNGRVVTFCFYSQKPYAGLLAACGRYVKAQEAYHMLCPIVFVALTRGLTDSCKIYEIRELA